MVVYCDYHSHREAIDKCQNCNRLLCLEDQVNVNITKSGRQYTVVCPTCSKDLTSTPWFFSRRIALMISILILGFFGFFLLFINSTGGSPFLVSFFGTFALIVVLMINGVFWIMRSMTLKSHKSTKSAKSGKYTQGGRTNLVGETKSESRATYCMHCGTTISGKEAKCLSCGEPLYASK